MKNLRFIITISKRCDAEEFARFFQTRGVPALFSVPCRGTARRKTLNLLGLEKSDKTATFCLADSEKTAVLMRRLVSEMYLNLPDMGVALAVPVGSVGGLRAVHYLAGEHAPLEEENEMQTAHELIIAIANSGYTEEVMDAARKAGARGGTVLHAKGTVGREASKFFGVSIADEKEMVFIVTPAEDKVAIMRAVMAEAGADSPAHALVFSLPVTAAAGFAASDADTPL